MLHCNEYDHTGNNGTYGSLSYGSSNANWEVGTYTIVYIFDNSNGHYTNRGSDGGGYGRMFLANEFEASGFNIRWFSQYQDTNVWDIRELIDPDADPQVTLASFVDNLPATVAEDYIGGSDPGFVPEEMVIEFADAYSSAIDGTIDNAEKAKAVLTRLETAYNALLTQRVQIKDGGYYYIKTANSDFTSPGNGEFAWVAPYDTEHAGWRAFKENDNQFIWQVRLLPTADTDTTASSTKKSGRMYYTFQNVGSGYYLGEASGHSNSQPVLFTTSDTTRIALTDLGQGQWNISSKKDYYDVYPPLPYHQQGHSGGSGTMGILMLWGGAAGSPSAWYIREVPEDQVAGINDPERRAVDNLRKYVVEYSNVTSGASVGPEVGRPHTQAEIDNVNEALRVANKFVSGDSVGTAEELAAAGTNLATLAEQFKKTINTVPDGYYTIRSAYANFVKNDNDAFFALYNDSTPGWKHYQKTTEQLWKVANVEGGYTIQNVKNGMYLNKAARSSNGSFVDMTTQPETTQLISVITPNGQVGIYNVEDSTFGYDPAGQGNGAGEVGRLKIWSPRTASGGTSWSLIPVSDADAQALIAAEPQNELNLKLQAAYEDSRALYNSNTNYTIGEPIIKAKEQLYANNWSPHEGGYIENMLDGDKNTFWNSTWEAGLEQDPANPHYLRIYDEAGLPDTVQVQCVMRQNAT